MNKVKFETKQEYLNYCQTNYIGTIPNCIYNKIENGIERQTRLDNGIFINEEPKSYPCIMIWEDVAGKWWTTKSGIFIYLDDFN